MNSFWSSPWGWTIITVGETLAVIVGVMVSLAFLLWGDRKVWAGVQMRKGPNVVGPFGLMQSFADFFKFVLKEVIIPAGSDKFIFLLAPLISFVLAFAAWAVIPFAPGWVVSDINVGILYLLGISSLGVYGIIMGGWASNSKYPFLGGLRSAAQMVSYEVSIGFIIVTVILLTGSINLSDIVRHQAGGIWNEWYALFDNGAWGWLAEAQGRYYVTFPVDARLKPGATFELGERWEDLVVTEIGVAELASAEGELPWSPTPGATYQYADLTGANKEFATFDYSEEEPIIFKGYYKDEEQT